MLFLALFSLSYLSFAEILNRQMKNEEEIRVLSYDRLDHMFVCFCRYGYKIGSVEIACSFLLQF